MSSSGDPQEAKMQAQWVLDAGNIPVPANQMLLQPGLPSSADGAQEGFYLTFGHINPPVFGDPTVEDNNSYLESNVFPVIPVGRFYLSRRRLEEFHRQIGAALQDSKGQVL